MFKIGDKVKGIPGKYGITSSQSVCKVIDTDKDLITVKLIKHNLEKFKKYKGEIFYDLPASDFELI